MKILLVSLLRLGDVIQQGALFKGLRQQFPDAEIHLLMNRQFSHVEEVLPGMIDKYIFFDREDLQRGLGEAGYNILYPYRRLEDLVNFLNQQNYDVAYNLTHTKLSAYLLGSTDITNIKGLSHAEGRFRGLSNRWLRYFNERFSTQQRSLFHYVELLGHSFKIPVVRPAQRLTTGKIKKKTVLFQCLTSQEKKNWSLENFRALKGLIETSLVDYHIRILGAAFEKEKLLQYFSEDELLICGLAEAKQHLQEAALLVTGDTSIKHLAAQAGTPIVEIAMGGSDALKTGAFADNAIILQSAVVCDRHTCGSDLSVEKVFTAVWDQLSGNHGSRVADFHLTMERAVWRLYLDEDFSPLAYEHAVREVHQELGAEHVREQLPVWIQETERLTTWLKQAQKAMPAREDIASRRQFQPHDIAELILVAQDILKSKADVAGYFLPFIEALIARFAKPVQIYDRISEALQDVEALLEVRIGFTQYLQIPSMEGPYYAKGIGKLSIGGFAETGKSPERTPEDPGIHPRDREASST